MGTLGCQFPQSRSPTHELAAEEALTGTLGCQFPQAAVTPPAMTAEEAVKGWGLHRASGLVFRLPRWRPLPRRSGRPREDDRR